jgi:hypothetical protein
VPPIKAWIEPDMIKIGKIHTSIKPVQGRFNQPAAKHQDKVP